MATRKTVPKGTNRPASSAKKQLARKDHQKKGLTVRRLFSRLFGLLILLLFIFVIGLGGYRFYQLERDIELLSLDQGIQQDDLAQLRQQDWSTRIDDLIIQLDDLTNDNTFLREQLVEQRNLNRLLQSKLANLEQTLSYLDTEDIDQQQLRSLIYLAERQRQLGDEPYRILSLLHQAHSIAVANPPSASVALVQALAKDIAEYQTISNLNKTHLLLELEKTLIAAKQLPYVTSIAEEEVPPETDYLSRMKNAFNSLGDYIRITRLEPQTPLFLTADDAALIQINLQLRLMQAQLAVLQGEASFYYSAISAAEHLVATTYPMSSAKDELLAKLSSLSHATIDDRPLPSLNSAAILAY